MAVRSRYLCNVSGELQAVLHICAVLFVTLPLGVSYHGSQLHGHRMVVMVTGLATIQCCHFSCCFQPFRSLQAPPPPPSPLGD